MKAILDKLLGNKKIAVFVPLSVACLLYILFALFGKSDNKIEGLLSALLIFTVWFFGVFFIVFMQVKNPRCPEWFLNFCELFVIFFFGLFSVASLLSFAFSGFVNFNLISACIGFVTYAAVAWAHSKRNN